MKLPENYPFKIDSSFGTIHFVDLIPIYGITKRNSTIDDALADFFSIDISWVNSLLKIRNILMKPFGLKGTNSEDTLQFFSKPFIPGEKAGFFTVKSRTTNEIVLYEADAHLNFYIYNTLLPANDGSYTYYCSTVVHYNNVFGKIYFFFVKPFHIIILKLMQKKAQRLFIDKKKS
ncbi:MAG: DUF2867 domain-containing protein [Bacteroidales bacterium]|nr:DUF2867 domain-containing protein [Bacteroidales bacterium]